MMGDCACKLKTGFGCGDVVEMWDGLWRGEGKIVELKFVNCKRCKRQRWKIYLLRVWTNFYISKCEIISFGKQRFSCIFGERIGEAVTKIECCTVSALSVFSPSGTRQLRLFSISRNYLATGPHKK